MPKLEPTGLIDLGDMRLEYRWIPPREPDAPILMFLHEGLGCVALWRDFPDRVALATGCGAFIYSRAGYGQSTPVPLPRPVRYMHDEGLDVLPRLLAKLNFHKVILIGHSDGGSIAIIHAGSGHADRVAGVATLAAHVFNEEVCVASIRQAKVNYETTDLRAKLARLHGDNVDCAFWGWNGAWLHPEFWHWNLEEYLPGIKVPMLVIQGRDDEYGTHRQYDAIMAQVGGPAELVVLDKCGHSPHRDQGEATLQAISDFVRRVAEGVAQ